MDIDLIIYDALDHIYINPDIKETILDNVLKSLNFTETNDHNEDKGGNENVI